MYIIFGWCGVGVKDSPKSPLQTVTQLQNTKPETSRTADSSSHQPLANHRPEKPGYSLSDSSASRGLSLCPELGSCELCLCHCFSQPSAPQLQCGCSFQVMGPGAGQLQSDPHTAAASPCMPSSPHRPHPPGLLVATQSQLRSAQPQHSSPPPGSCTLTTTGGKEGRKRSRTSGTIGSCLSLVQAWVQMEPSNFTSWFQPLGYILVYGGCMLPTLGPIPFLKWGLSNWQTVSHMQPAVHRLWGARAHMTWELHASSAACGKGGHMSMAQSTWRWDPSLCGLQLRGYTLEPCAASSCPKVGQPFP